ncbi:MAG: hypothetical protein V4722_20890 [Bacteroidota bacterium]
MKTKLVAFVAAFALVSVVKAQQKDKSTVNQFADFTLGVAGGQGSVALGYVHNWKLFKKQKLEAGLGTRFTSYFGSNKYYRTAPAKLTSGKTGPGVIFSDDIIQNIDSVLFPKAQVNMLNLSINFGYHVTSRFSLGLNIDAIGFSFGGSKNGTYINGNVSKPTSGQPTAFNLLLVSDNDKGSLNSELFAHYEFNKKWGVKIGFEFLFAEYKTVTEVQTTPDGQKNDRFRNKISALALGITYQL